MDYYRIKLIFILVSFKLITAQTSNDLSYGELIAKK